MQKTPFKILMADDDPDDCMIVRDAFKQVTTGIDFTCVENGIELLDYLKRQDKYAGEPVPELPHLILLDLNMPRKNGKEALKEIKADASLSAVPIVIFTTSSEKKDIDLCYKLGASAFITKPMGFDALVDVLKTLSRYGFETTELSQ
jgi:two-component system response regulator